MIGRPINIKTLLAMKEREEKIVALTCYDANFASVMDEAGVEILLVGDSLGMTIQGHETTLPVNIEDMIYHTTCVARGRKNAFLIADLPFGSYPNRELAFENAARLMKAGAQMVKMEGGRWLCDTIRFLVERAIPVCAHLGLTPQSIHQFGGFRVQGKTPDSAAQIKAESQDVQAAGAAMLVLEGIPSHLGAEITKLLHIPTIGIGAGPDCSGQVLVKQDILGLYQGRPLRFTRDFMKGNTSIQGALKDYVHAVKRREFPGPEHCFSE